MGPESLLDQHSTQPEGTHEPPPPALPLVTARNARVPAKPPWPERKRELDALLASLDGSP